MKSLLNRVWQEDEGVLTFEWILLITVLVIGTVGALSAVRDAVILELGDVAEAMIALDQSYVIDFPMEVLLGENCEEDGASYSSYTDAAGIETQRGSLIGQGVTGDCASTDEEPLP